MEQPLQPKQEQNKQQNKPISSPTKQQRLQKKRKNHALKSFLLRNDSQSTKIQIANSGNLSEHQQTIIQQEQNQCVVCRIQLGKNKRSCGFCKMSACSQHLRKKRKSKQHGGKFIRICDECQDKHLFQKYMKSEVKAEESLLAQQLIIGGQHQQTRELLETKQAKVTLLNQKKGKLRQDHQDFLKQIQVTENQINAKLAKMARKTMELDAQQSELQKIEAKLPRPLDDDFGTLKEEDQKITKQLVKYEKLCHEAIQAKSKREKQIYDYYYEWQQKQKQKLARKQNEKDCAIY